MIVRIATVADARSIAEVHVASWQVAYRGQVPDDYLDGLSVDVRESAWTRILAHTGWPEGTLTFVLVDEELSIEEGTHGRTLGFANLGPSRDEDADAKTGELRSIYLDSVSWGEGYGRMLMSEAMRTLQSWGCRVAIVWVLDTNARARRFYEAAGWYADGAEKVDESRGFSLREVRYRSSL